MRLLRLRLAAHVLRGRSLIYFDGPIHLAEPLEASDHLLVVGISRGLKPAITVDLRKRPDFGLERLEQE